MHLRDYQTRDVERIRLQYRHGKRRVLYQLSPRGGKTPLFGFIAKGAADKGNVVYILVHRDYLIEQTSDKLDQFGVPHGIIAPGFRASHEAVQVCSVMTLTRRLDKLPRPTFVVVDEAHHATSATYSRILEWANCAVLGVTATPSRLDGRGLNEWFDVLVQGASPRELIAAGWVAKPRVYAPAVIPDVSGVGVHAGDYDTHALAAIMGKPTVVGDVIDHYRRLADRKPTVAFCPDIDSSEVYAASFRAAGYTAECLSSKTPHARRMDVMARFRAGRVNVVTNCDLISEGFDMSGVMAVLLLRRTMSLTLYIQQAFRCLNAGSDGVILDHVGNCFLHGLPDDDREWTLKGRDKKKRGDKDVKVPATRQCPTCYSVHKPAPVCPFCGHTYEITGRETAQVDGTLEEITLTPKKVAAARAWTESERKQYEYLKGVGAKRGYPKADAWAKHVVDGRVKKMEKRAHER